MRRPLPLALAAACLATLAVPAVASSTDRTDRHRYDVTITRTEYGIPHIVADDYGSLGYGYGYAFAQDNLCTMAADYITVEGRRSQWFGRDNHYTMQGNGVTVSNIDSDFFWTQVRDSHFVDRLLARPAPFGPKPEIKVAVAGYVAGYNRWLHDIGGPDGIKDPACHGKRWVHPITTEDAFLRFYQLVLLAGQDVVMPGIAQARPPSPTDPVPTAAMNPQKAARLLATGWHQAMGGLGSNAVAVGAKGTRNGRGLLLGNPHFPWTDTERFYQAHLTIPGELDVSGASLFGVPIVLIGHTATMAWSHTVSTAFRFTPYQLTLVPGDPTSYLLDGQPTKMEPRQVTVTVQRPTAQRPGVKETRTLWWTRYGPVFNSILGIPLPWTLGTAFAIRDANVDNFRIFNHFFDTNHARTAKQELGILKKYQGIPWVNTVVADKWGHALYADIGTIPNVPNDMAQQCNTALGAATYQLLGLPVLDGSTTSCDWRKDPDAVQPGLFGPSHLPHLFRSDYVTNSNDSYWLSNPKHPLEGFARIIGDERTPRSLRTRIGLIMTADNAKKGFTRKLMQREVFSDRQYAGMLTRDDLVGVCRQAGALGYLPTTGGAPVEVGNACDVLAKWNLREDLDSRGAVLFRRFWDRLSGGNQGTVYAYSHVAPYWKTSFDADNAVRTPAGLNALDPEVTLALGDAIADLRKAGIPLDVALGKQQYVEKNGVRYPIHGGIGDPHGDFNAIWAGWDPEKGVTSPSGGSSFIQVVTWNDGPCPDARTILTYSQSTDPTNPHYADQTALFSKKRWVVDRFCRSAIAASPVKQVKHLVG
ncbi:MAG TPA: penicillin acylase family protein [Mycobacteriales bacterium]|jgi:acyl-homoserine-lactone acylase|nr:penicillin acylase family protein [Mycobacteriales bacterium]